MWKISLFVWSFFNKTILLCSFLPLEVLAFLTTVDHQKIYIGKEAMFESWIFKRINDSTIHVIVPPLKGAFALRTNIELSKLLLCWSYVCESEQMTLFVDGMSFSYNGNADKKIFSFHYDMHIWRNRFQTFILQNNLKLITFDGNLYRFW